MADQFTEFYDVPADKIEIIRNGAILDPLTPEDRATKRTQTRQLLQFDDDHVAFAWVGGDYGRKGLLQLLPAFADLHKKHPSARLIVTGTLAWEPVHLANTLGINAAVHFTGPTDNVQAIFAAADVAVLPSNYDPASKVTLEALICSTPVIASAYDGSSDWLIETDDTPSAGLIVADPMQIETITEAMTEMMDVATREKFAAAATSRCDQLHMDRHVEALEKCFQKLVNASTV